MSSRIWRDAASTLALLAASGVFGAGAAHAQGSQDALRETITITGTKQAEGVNVQDAPIAVTAYGDEQLDALFVRDLKSLTFNAPNVQLEDIGTTRGVANFTIRGLGINSSIPSVDPAVGVFVDGVYIGTTNGVVLDMFDLEGIEILRGPQGILFGRNVTGGAVLVNSKGPSDELEITGKVAVETGLNKYAMGAVSGPLTDTLSARLSVYYNDDEGWFTNRLDGSQFGKAETTLIRPSIRFAPNDTFDATLRYERGTSEGDGPASQNNRVYSRETFEFAIDEPGFYDNTWDFASMTANWDVAGGTLTGIVGYRNFEADSLGDIDASPQFLFHAPSTFTSVERTGELRYNGTFDRTTITAGLFYFDGEKDYIEGRNLASFLLGLPSPPFPPVVPLRGGAYQEQFTYAGFGQVDFALTEVLKLSLGGRYSYEEKDVQIANISPASGCVLGSAETSCNFAGPVGFIDDDSWNSFTPKVGLQWTPYEDLNVFGSYTEGARSGGYNFRSTSTTALPGPYDDEKVKSLEAGFKKQGLGEVMDLSFAVFYNQVEDMQREVNEATPTGIVQIIRNTADADLYGAETEFTVFASDKLTFLGSLGYVKGEYTDLAADLSGNGILDGADFDLEIPRLAPLTYSLTAIYDQPIGDMGTITARAGYSHRDMSFYTDNNLGFFNPADIVDASVSWTAPSDQLVVSIYGKNLTADVQHGGDSQLFAGPLARTFSPLNKGNVIGIEAQFKY